MGIEAVLRQAMSALHVLVSLAGLGVCVMHLRRSRWMLLPAAGFGVQAAVTIGYQAAAMLIGRGGFSASLTRLVMLALSALGLLAAVAIVGGLAAVLSDPELGARPEQRE